MNSLAAINTMPKEEAQAALLRCCGARSWVEFMLGGRPFASGESLTACVGKAFAQMRRDDWLEAFAAHPRIGDVATLREKFATTSQWCAGEQAGVDGAHEQVLQALVDGNREYEKKFGHIFIVCATGKSAAEMLTLLKSRLPNDSETELGIAAAEQMKITSLRLEKL